MPHPHAAPRKPFLAQGLDYQGRHPQAASACSEFLTEPGPALEPPRWLQRLGRLLAPLEHWLVRLHDAAERVDAIAGITNAFAARDADFIIVNRRGDAKTVAGAAQNVRHYKIVI